MRKIKNPRDLIGGTHSNTNYSISWPRNSLREGLMSLLPKVVYSTGSDVARHQTIEIR